MPVGVGLEWVDVAGVGARGADRPGGVIQLGQVGVMPFGRDTSVAGPREWPAVPFEHAGVPGFAAET